MAVIFATKTTIDSGAHRKLLVEKGLPGDRIIGEACPRLAGAIERGTASEETAAYVRAFVAEALERLPEKHGRSSRASTARITATSGHSGKRRSPRSATRT